MKDSKSDSKNSVVDLSDIASPEEVKVELEKILGSSEFAATKAQRDFLQYVVEKSLAGEEDQIKGYSIATQVLGRREDFNQSIDPIVSVQASKLRKALERYYLVAGQDDPVAIEIPKGTYSPVFIKRKGLLSSPGKKQLAASGFFAGGNWPSLAIHPLDNLTGNPDCYLLGVAFAAELAMEITRYQEIQVVMNVDKAGSKESAGSLPRFVLTGNLVADPGGHKMLVALTDQKSGLQIWGQAYQGKSCPAELLPFAGVVARAVAGKICSEHGVIARKMAVEAVGKTSLQLSTYEALLAYYQFKNSHGPDTYNKAAKALWSACNNEPDNGLVWSMLARLHATNLVMEFVAMDYSLDDILGFAQTGVRLDPANQRTRGALSFVLLLKDELKAAQAEAERALALNPHSLIFVEHIGYLLVLMGDWLRGVELIRKALAVNPYYNDIVHHALWLDMFRQKRYQEAYLETLAFRTPELYWDPICRAATLGHLGRVEEGRVFAEKLLQLRPDFPERGFYLIKRLIKLDFVLAQIAEGLHRVGVDLKDC